MPGSSDILRSRALTVADATVCASWLVSHERLSLDLHQQFVGILARLLQASRLQGVLIEEHDGLAGHWKARAIGLSAFVCSEAFDAYLSAPTPFLAVDLILRSAADPSVLLGPNEQARGNASCGIDLVAHFMQGGWDFAAPLWRTVGSLGHAAYVRDHRGFRINRILQEDWAREPDIYLASGYTRRTTFTDGSEGPRGARVCSGTRDLYYAEAAEVGSRAPGTTVSYVLQYTPPRCGFTPAEQRVLSRAVEGHTDQKISELQNSSLNTIKMHWRNIYDKVQAERPMVLEQASGADSGSGRGLEKRRRVIAFAEEHPQELRPYVPSR